MSTTVHTSDMLWSTQVALVEALALRDGEAADSPEVLSLARRLHEARDRINPVIYDFAGRRFRRPTNPYE